MGVNFQVAGRLLRLLPIARAELEAKGHTNPPEHEVIRRAARKARITEEKAGHYARYFELLGKLPGEQVRDKVSGGIETLT